MSYFNIATYARTFSPCPKLEWSQANANEFCCTAGRATLRVFRGGDGKPWWVECENPAFESKTWFYTAEQAQYWAEKEIQKWFG